MKRKKCHRQIDENRLNWKEDQNTKLRAITRNWTRESLINNSCYYCVTSDAEDAT